MTRIVVFGGGTVAGLWDVKGGWTQRLKTHLDRKTLESEGNEYYELYSLGIRGDSTAEILERFDEEISNRMEHIEDENEDVVAVFQVGANDAQFVFEEDDIKTSHQRFQENIRELAEKANQKVDKVVFIGLTPVDDSNLDPIPSVGGRSFNNNRLKKYSQLLRETCKAEEMNAEYIHLFDKFNNQGPEELLEDGLHLNSEGHKLVFQTVKKRFQKSGIL